MRLQSELKYTSFVVVWPSDMDNLWDRAENLIMPGAQGHVFCSPLHVSSWWRRLRSVTNENELANDEEREEVGIRKTEVFEVERKSFFPSF